MMIKEIKAFLRRWRIVIFCMLFAAASVTAIWMKALDRQVSQKINSRYSVMCLELPENQDGLTRTLQQVANSGSIRFVHTNLLVDFAFMPAVYGLVAFWLLLIRRGNVKKWLRGLLLLLAAMQIIPWILDITENTYLLKVLQHPLYYLDMNIDIFKLMVKTKFIISFGGAATALSICVLKAVKKDWVYKT